MCAWEFTNIQSQIKGEILIGVPYKNNPSPKFINGLMSAKFPDYFAHSVMFLSGQPLDISRNIVVSNGLQRKVSHILFLDEDIILKPDTITDLKEVNFPIAGAVYFGRNPPYDVVANINGKPVTRNEIIEKRGTANNGKGMMEITEIGMGATLIDIRVFERIAITHKLPWFCLLRHPGQLDEVEKDDTGIYYTFEEAQALGYHCKYCGNTLIAPFFDYRIGKYAENSLSEDYYFCKIAREAGFQIFVAIHADVHHELHDITIGIEGITNTTVTAGLI